MIEGDERFHDRAAARAPAAHGFGGVTRGTWWIATLLLLGVALRIWHVLFKIDLEQPRGARP